MTREQKIKQLRARGWSEARIDAHIRHWYRFDVSTKTSRNRDDERKQSSS